MVLSLFVLYTVHDKRKILLVKALLDKLGLYPHLTVGGNL